jgi:branched-chain amino acid transport system substrate-binding protein
MIRRLLSHAALGVATLCTLTACSGSGSGNSGTATSSGGSTNNQLIVRAVAALSGQLAAVGSSQQAGARAAVAVINAQGGVLGHPIDYSVADDAGDPTQTVTQLTSILGSTPKPQVVIPGSTSSEISAALPMLAKAGVFVSDHSGAANLNDPKKYPFTFSNAFNPDDQSENIASKLKSMGITSVGVIDADDARGQDNIASYKKVFSADGIQISTALVPDSAVDATPQLQQLMSESPKALVVNAFAPTATAIIAAINKLDIQVPIIGSQTFTSSVSAFKTADLSKVTLQALTWTVKGTPIQSTPAWTTFWTAVKKEAPTLTFNVNNYTIAYNAVVLAAAAATKAGSTDPAKMAAAAENLTSTDAPLYIGPLNFTATDHMAKTDSQYWYYTKAIPQVDGLLVPSS